MYTDATTTVRTSKDAYTDPINIGAGVKQGCSISAILFNLTSELIIQSVLSVAANNPDLSFSCHGQKISVLAYADDIVLISRQRNGLQTFLDAATEAANILELSFRADKCASLSLTCGNAESRFTTITFHIQDTAIPALQRNDSTYTLVSQSAYYAIPWTCQISLINLLIIWTKFAIPSLRRGRS